MTRINLVHPEKLHKKHLLAEYREIMRLPELIIKYHQREKKTVIPEKYTMGKGHVTFFYNKGLFLKKRFASLCKQLKQSGVKISFQDTNSFDRIPIELMNDYHPDIEAIKINVQRLDERLSTMKV